jgi:hypothetical protein
MNGVLLRRIIVEKEDTEVAIISSAERNAPLFPLTAQLEVWTVNAYLVPNLCLRRFKL